MQKNNQYETNISMKHSKITSPRRKTNKIASELFQSDESQILRYFLSPNHQKISQVFNVSQQKVIAKQFDKMIKNLKDRINIDQKVFVSPSKEKTKNKNIKGKQLSISTIKEDLSKQQIKTQRIQYNKKGNFSKLNLCEQPYGTTVKRISNSDRKMASNDTLLGRRSPKSKKTVTLQQISSPRKHKNHSKKQHCAKSQISSKKKNKKMNLVKCNVEKQRNKQRQTQRKNGKNNHCKQVIAQKILGQNPINIYLQNNYYLHGDQFIQIDDRESLNLQNSMIKSIKFAQQIQNEELSEKFQQNSSSIETTKKLYNFFTQKDEQQKDQRQYFQQFYQQSQQICSGQKLQQLTRLKDNDQCLQTKNPFSPLDIQENQQKTLSKFYSNGSHSHNNTPEEKNFNRGQNNRNLVQCQNLNSEQNYFQIFSNYSKSGESPDISSINQQFNEIGCLQKDQQVDQKIKAQQELINIRIDAINGEMKAKKQVLDKLMKNNSISRDTYQQYLDLLMEKYEIQISQAEKLKQMIYQNSVKVQSLIQKNKDQEKWIKQAERGANAQEILNQLFQFSQNSKKDGNQNQKILNTSQQTNAFDIFPDCLKQSQIQEQQFLDSQQQKQELIKMGKMLIEQRIGQQMGIGSRYPNQNRIQSNIKSVNSSVGGIFQFLKAFSKFVLYYHKVQLLRYINMPYGYSVVQRLIYMQGYDDESDSSNSQNQFNYCQMPKKGMRQSQEDQNYVYGLQQIISPKIFQQFYRHLINSYKALDKNKPAQDEYYKYEKIHNRAIFDTFNEILNEYRPYYFVGGTPYPWNCSQKTITFFFISQENVDEVLQKSQFQLLKWSSMLCGLQVPQLVKQNTSAPYALQQIFAKYTSETHEILLQNRQQKNMKMEVQEICKKNYQWSNLDEHKTTILYEVSSLIIEELALQLSQMLSQRSYRLSESLED